MEMSGAIVAFGIFVALAAGAATTWWFVGRREKGHAANTAELDDLVDVEQGQHAAEASATQSKAATAAEQNALIEEAKKPWPT